MNYLNNLENNVREVCSDCGCKGTEKCNYSIKSLIWRYKCISILVVFIFRRSFVIFHK
jgi:hypothetical protein